MPYERSRALEAARRILEQRGWCVYEVCVEGSEPPWEARTLFFDLTAEAVADGLEAEIELEPEYDGRLVGCDQRTLCPAPAMGAHLVYVANGAQVAGSGARSRATC